MADLLRPVLLDNFGFFVQKVFQTVSPSNKYLSNWHIELIGEYLMACQRGEIKRLIINLPPRFMKSICVSVAFPAWLLGHNPRAQIMCASYAMSLSHKHSMDSRLLLEQPWYRSLFPKTELVGDQNTKSKFVTTERGFRLATSIGSAVTGAGADFLIIDDPLNAQDANSEVAIANANNWYDQVFSTRLNDPKTGCIILIMQRLHVNDLTGHLLSKDSGWEHLCIPLIAEKDEILERGSVRVERQEGDPLHHQRLGDAEIMRLKRDLGPYGFAGQFQQQPAPSAGGTFRREWLQYYDKIELSTLNLYMLIDPANSKHKSSDYTAIMVIGLGQDNNLYVVDMIRDRLDVRGREDIIFELHKRYRPMGVGVEKYGMQVESDWLKYAMERRNYRFAITEVGGTMDKISRIKRLEAMFARGQIWLPRRLDRVDYQNRLTDLTQEFINQEYLTFPVGGHDDMLDALSRLFDISLQYPGTSNFNYHEFAAGF